MELQQALRNVEEYEAAFQDRDDWARIYNERRLAIMAYVQDDLDALEVEMRPYLDLSQLRVVESERVARESVLELGSTVEGKLTQFVWNKGKTTWDGKKLDGMADIIPELKAAKRVGSPSVSVRTKEKE